MIDVPVVGCECSMPDYKDNVFMNNAVETVIIYLYVPLAIPLQESAFPALLERALDWDSGGAG
jgi:hypothetical protein